MLTDLPVLPGLHIDAHHIKGDGRRCSDRAWFDVIGLADGRTAMLIGDVVEQIVAGAAGTGRVRGILTQMLADGRDLEAVLDAMHTAVYARDAACATTVCVAILDPADGSVQYGTCGHAPPMVVRAQGGTRQLRSCSGADPDTGASIVIEHDRLDRDDVLVLHTGNASPEIRRAMAAELAGLPDATGRTPATGETVDASRTETICRRTANGLRHADARKDLAVLAVQSRPDVGKLALTVPAVAASLEPAEQAVGDWLAGLRSSIDDGAGMVLAVREAMANAIQHAFVGARAGSVMVEAMLLADGVLVCSVSDDGRWLPAESSRRGRRGRGLGLMARLCDRMLIHRGRNGTVIELRRRLHHPVIRSGAEAEPIR